MSDQRTDFQKFLFSKFQEYEFNLGHRVTYKEFAAYLEVDRPLLSQWLNGDHKPGPDNINKLAEKLGVEVYEVLGLDPLLQSITAHWDELPEEIIHKINQLTAPYLTDSSSGGEHKFNEDRPSQIAQSNL